MSQWVHDERTPGGLGQRITLTPDALVRESKGALGGGISVSIPLASIQGFYAVSYQHRSLGGAPRGTIDQFLVSWVDREGRARTETWMVDVTAPSFGALLAGLAQLRPDASLLALSVAEAHRRLGRTSLDKTQLYVVLGVLGAFVLVGGCIGVALLAALFG